MSHILNAVEEGTELEITGVKKEGSLDVKVGMTFVVTSSRSKSALPDGSMPHCQHIASTEHEIPNYLGEKQIKSVNDEENTVIIPWCEGGARVTMEEI